VSAERVRDEWLKTMGARRPSVAFDAMRRTSILGVVSPELMEGVGCAQNRWHAFDVWGHAMACLDACKPDAILRVAALLHDVAKPRTRAFSEKTRDYTFYGHERLGAEMADVILVRLRFSNEDRAKIGGLVRNHLICYSDEWSDAAVRHWLRRVGPNRTADLFNLGTADALAKGRDVSAEIAALQRLRLRAEALVAQGAALSTKDLAIGGNDLMTILHMQPGRVIGDILKHLVERVTDDPSLNNRDALLDEARRFRERT
jgi:tRNA nucleotidyltransferase (CCA-adding enzyme)